MKNINLCDNGEFNKIADLCEKYETGIEIQAFYDPEYLINNPDAINAHLTRIKNIKKRSMHGPFADLCFGSFDRLIKEATASRYEYAYDIAQKTGCMDIVLHHGYVPGTSHYANWLKRGVIFWNEFLKNKSADITFHIENMLELGPDLISEIVSETNNSKLDVCLDTGHANCNSKTSVLEWVEKLNKQIGYVHLHNNYGIKDEHLGFKKGTIPFKEMCQTLEEYSPDAIWAIETNNESMEESIIWLQDNGFWDGTDK
ncbi:MAG: sugar phosphate isomerase/epimerase family protein [Saccharofermentanales bacterium]